MPEQAVDVLGVPVYAPWMKIAEAADYVHAVKPRVSVPIHEGMLTNPPFVDALLERFTAGAAPLRQLVKVKRPRSDVQANAARPAPVRCSCW